MRGQILCEGPFRKYRVSSWSAEASRKSAKKFWLTSSPTVAPKRFGKADFGQKCFPYNGAERVNCEAVASSPAATRVNGVALSFTKKSHFSEMDGDGIAL